MKRRTNRRTDGGRPGPLGAAASWLVAVALVTAALTGGAVATAGAPGAADDGSAATESAFVVALEEDGDATATVEVGFDLSDDSDRAAFEAFRENETKRDRLATRTERRFRAVAENAANETDREMAIENVRVTAETVDGGDRGVVSVSADWRGFAATADGRLRVTEPFASGFTADRPVVLESPDGYALVESDPTPAENADGRAVWDANASLEGFEAVIAPTDAEAGSDSLPGPGVVAASTAIGAAVWLHRRR